VNLVLTIHEETDFNKHKYNRIPDGNYTFIEIYKYLLPFIEPIDTFVKIEKNKPCNCGKKHKL